MTAPETSTGLQRFPSDTTNALHECPDPDESPCTVSYVPFAEVAHLFEDHSADGSSEPERDPRSLHTAPGRTLTEMADAIERERRRYATDKQHMTACRGDEEHPCLRCGRGLNLV